jgi:outer membrane protein assembly factor BamB
MPGADRILSPDAFPLPVISRVFFTGILAALLPTTAGAEDWPHWRGVKRDGKSAESSKFDEGAWPLKKAAWTARVGEGSSSMLVVGGMLYTLGWKGGKDTVSCLDAANGKVIWTQSYKSPDYGRRSTGDKSMYNGPSGTPEYDSATRMLYTLSIDGLLACWNTAARGTKIWSLNLYEEYDVPQRPQVTKRPRSHRDYGYPGAPFVFKDWVIVEVGDPKRGNLFAFDKRSGKLAWTSENKDHAGHTGGLSPIVVEGVPCLAVLTAHHLCVTRIDGKNAGKTVAEYRWVTDFINNIATPAVEGNTVVITSRYNRMAVCKLAISLRGGARKLWETKEGASGVCSPIVHDGHVYFASKGLYCLDGRTGETKWVQGNFDSASSLVLTGDERLIVWANKGELALVETARRSPDKYRELAKPKRVMHRDAAWPHVVLAGGRLFCKDRNGEIQCFELKGR